MDSEHQQHRQPIDLDFPAFLKNVFISPDSFSTMFEKYDYSSSGISGQYLRAGESLGRIVQSMVEIQSMVNNMQQDVTMMKGDIRNILSKLDDMVEEAYGEPRAIQEMPVDEIKKMILAEMGVDKPFYPSDVALRHNLDYDAVLKAVDALRKEGRIRG